MSTSKLLRQAIGQVIGIGWTLGVLLLAGCGGASTTPTIEATPIPPTATPVPPTATPVPPAATAVPTAQAEDVSELQPLGAAECSGLADDMSQTLGIPGEITQAEFQDFITQRAGTGCQATITGTGLDFESVEVVMNALRRMIHAQRWYEDMRLGGGGPTGQITGFRQADKMCRLTVGWEPSEDVECPSDQPIGMCEMSPEQRLYTISLNCVQDTAAAIPEWDLEPQRIQFSPGAISAQVGNSLTVGGADRYVLTVAAGQEILVDLSVTSALGPADMSTMLNVWGVDGAPLRAGFVDARVQVETLSTQDYYIDVISVVPDTVDYTMEVIVPPATTGHPEVPATFQPVLAQLESTGVPLVLPPDFPIEAGLPAIHPYVYTAEPGEYELSLDFGPDCLGAGACHYGSLTGKQVDTNEPVGTRSFEFDAARAQRVVLANDIEGYFIESVCGANCDDAKVFWIYNGFQYMVGMKAGRQADVLDLANVAIANSLQ